MNTLDYFIIFLIIFMIAFFNIKFNVKAWYVINAVLILLAVISLWMATEMKDDTPEDADNKKQSVAVSAAWLVASIGIAIHFYYKTRQLQNPS